MKGLFIPEITTEMFRNGCLESIEALMADGEIYDIEYSRWIPVSERLPEVRYDKCGNLISNEVIIWCEKDSEGGEYEWYDVGFFRPTVEKNMSRVMKKLI